MESALVGLIDCSHLPTPDPHPLTLEHIETMGARVRVRPAWDPNNREKRRASHARNHSGEASMLARPQCGVSGEEKPAGSCTRRRADGRESRCRCRRAPGSLQERTTRLELARSAPPEDAGWSSPHPPPPAHRKERTVHSCASGSRRLEGEEHQEREGTGDAVESDDQDGDCPTDSPVVRHD